MEEPAETQKLFRSVKFGKTKEVKEALDQRPQLLPSVDSNGNTLLHMVRSPHRHFRTGFGPGAVSSAFEG
jgi:hypothetical protein